MRGGIYFKFIFSVIVSGSQNTDVLIVRCSKPGSEPDGKGDTAEQADDVDEDFEQSENDEGGGHWYFRD
jgi:hypothetical protein